jgi:hypothetical protein
MQLKNWEAYTYTTITNAVLECDCGATVTQAFMKFENVVACPDCPKRYKYWGMRHVFAQVSSSLPTVRYEDVMSGREIE